MDDLWLIRENIARYRRLIESEADGAKRSFLERLLAECMANLRRGELRVPTALSNAQGGSGPDALFAQGLADEPDV